MFPTARTLSSLDWKKILISSKAGTDFFACLFPSFRQDLWVDTNFPTLFPQWVLGLDGTKLFATTILQCKKSRKSSVYNMPHHKMTLLFSAFQTNHLVPCGSHSSKDYWQQPGLYWAFLLFHTILVLQQQVRVIQCLISQVRKLIFKICWDC